ncbi:hypothetical protein BKA70DRAFT_1105186, partial [Coprinopsis sp. MPI-PUGE-AT-0042]
GQLKTNGRPLAITKWIKSKGKKKAEIPEFDLSEFSQQLVEWWRLLQPSWHSFPEGPRSLPDGADWSSLVKVGPAGIYTVIVPLAWTLHAGGGTSDIASDLWDMVDDVTWVLQQIITEAEKPVHVNTEQAQSGGKRRLDNEASGSTRKRCVFLVLHGFVY